MSGIYGFSKYGKLALSDLNQLVSTMKLYDYFVQDELFEDEAIAASRVHLGKIGEKTSPSVLGNVRVWVEGEAYNHCEVARTLGLQKLGFADLLLEAYATHQLDEFLNDLDGYFCAVIYDKDTQKIKLISDRYGMRMLYWYAKGGSFAWGSEVKAILSCVGVDNAIDPTSYDCFMDLGYLLGENTWFEHIKLIKPATILTYDISTQQIDQYYYWTWAEIKPSHLGFDEAVDELGDCFLKAVGRRIDLNEKIGIALSGGLDSRAIFAAVNHLYPDYRGYAYTFGVPVCDDITIAEKVVSRSMWTHESFHITSQNWFQPRKEKVWNTDGMLDMMHMHGGEFLGDVSTHIDINLSGYLGDAIFGGSYHDGNKFSNRKPDKEVVSMLYNNHLQDGFVDSYYDIKKMDPLLFMCRGRRFIQMGISNSLVSVDQRMPFFDNNCVELIYSLPDEYRLNNRLYSTMLQQTFRKYFKDIPWQKTGKPAGVVGASSVSSRAFKKILRHLQSVMAIKSSKSYTNYKEWISSNEVVEALVKLLDPKDAFYAKFTQSDYLTECLSPHLKRPSVDNSRQILRLATVEIYMRQVKDHHQSL